MRCRKVAVFRAITVVWLLILLTQLSLASSPNPNVSFRASRSFDAGNGGHSSVFDINGDGKLDYVGFQATGTKGEVTVLLGNGDGTFQPPLEYPVNLASPGAIQIADFNADDKPDIAVFFENVSYSLSIAILLGNGDGTFQAPVVTNLNVPGPPSGNFVSGDFDGNGKADLAVIIPLPQVGTVAIAVLLGIGDGTFQPANLYDVWRN